MSPITFGLSFAPFGMGPVPFGLSLSKPLHARHPVGVPFDKLRANGGSWLRPFDQLRMLGPFDKLRVSGVGGGGVNPLPFGLRFTPVRLSCIPFGPSPIPFGLSLSKPSPTPSA